MDIVVMELPAIRENVSLVVPKPSIIVVLECFAMVLIVKRRP